MSTRSCIIVKVHPRDIGGTIKFNPKALPVKQNGWGGEASREKALPVTVEHEYLGVYCHWDGFPSNTGEALKKKFNLYQKALNLVIGGSISSVSTNAIRRYSKRKGEYWNDIKPVQKDSAEKICKWFGWSCYCYLYDYEKGDWLVWDCSEENGTFKEFNVSEDEA